MSIVLELRSQFNTHTHTHTQKAVFHVSLKVYFYIRAGLSPTRIWKYPFPPRTTKISIHIDEELAD